MPNFFTSLARQTTGTPRRAAGNKRRMALRGATIGLLAASLALSACSFYKPRYELRLYDLSWEIDTLGYLTYEYKIDTPYAEGLGDCKIFFEAKGKDGSVMEDDNTIPLLLQGNSGRLLTGLVWAWPGSVDVASIRPTRVEFSPQVNVSGVKADFTADGDGWKAVWP